MAEQQSGLRFDIYERVHLQDEARGILELDEVELVPHIQVVSQSDQAVLKGHLRLSGSYMSEEGEGTKSLEHHIPVEITLPISRVGNAQDLLVEIENFDVDLMSPRSLNVTGVLSLHGVEMASEQETGSRFEEQLVFVHRLGEDGTAGSGPADEALRSESAAAGPASEAVRSEPKAPVIVTEVQPHVGAPQQPSKGYSFPPPATVVAEQALEQPPAPSVVEAKPLDVDIDVNVEETEIIAGDAEPIDEAELMPEVVLHAEEKKDVKVALGSKKVTEIAQDAAYGIKSLLQKSSSIFLDKRKAGETAAAPPAEDARTESVEWKKLFLSSTADGQEFRKLKMAIVQKEETLETIAQRYQLNPRELQLINRLQDGDIAEGQVIYIPR